MNIIAEAGARVRAEYGSAIGRRPAELTTPALVLDLPAAKRNIDRMVELTAPMPAGLRPHFKTHKSPELALLQARAGVVGMSVATVWEAAILADVGLDDLFVVNQVVGPAKIGALAALARDRRISVAVDDLGNVSELARAAVAAGAVLGVLIEIDTGMRRCGLTDASQVIRLAQRVAESPGLEFRGVTGYEGHCSLEDDVGRRRVLQQEAMAVLLGCADALSAAGLPCRIVSAGGTRTWWLTASTPGVTEIQAGTYVLMDRFHSGVEGGFQHALRVVSTVISSHPDRFVIDAGSKTIGDADDAAIVGMDAANLGADEEHGRFAAARSRVAVGDVVEVIPGYAPATVNLFDAYHVVENGVVSDIWPVIPRGPGHHGLMERN